MQTRRTRRPPLAPLGPLALFALLAAVLAAPPLRAEDWPAWRGPRGDGISREASAPLPTGDEVLWRVVPAALSHSGEVLWRTSPCEFHSMHGFCISPVLHDDLVILNADQDSPEASLVALDRRTGETRWRTERANHTRSYVTPLIADL